MHRMIGWPTSDNVQTLSSLFSKPGQQLLLLPEPASATTQSNCTHKQYINPSIAAYPTLPYRPPQPTDIRCHSSNVLIVSRLYSYQETVE